MRLNWDCLDSWMSSMSAIRRARHIREEKCHPIRYGSGSAAAETAKHDWHLIFFQIPRHANNECNDLRV